MAIEELLAALERDAAADREAILAEARAEVERIRTRTSERHARHWESFLEPREREWRRAAAVAVAQARRGVRGDVLAAQQRFLDRVFAEARARLSDAMLGEEYRRVLSVHVEETLAYLCDEPCLVRCPPPLEAPVRSIVASRKNVSVVVDPESPPGIVVESRDGAIAVNNTLEGRLERLAPILALELVARSGVAV